MSDIDDTLERVTYDYYLCLFNGIAPESASDLISRCHAIASAMSNNEIRFQALMMVLQLAQHLPPADSVHHWCQAADLLVEGYLNSPEVCRIFEDYSVLPPELQTKADECLNRILEVSTNDAVIAGCRYARVTQSIVKEQYLGGLTSEERAAAVRELDKLRNSYGEQPNANPRLHFGSTLAEVANGDVFELEQLCIGAIAPEIVGEDSDGVPGRLSDYRGRVVMLKFWGYW